jgi:pimeloyl-ACP methyl ester carboxylesterase
LKNIPNWLARYGSKVFDTFESRNNPIYRAKTHQRFNTDGHAMLGALKIKDIRKLVEDLENAPSLYNHSKLINIPNLFIYGGEDHFLGIHQGKLPLRYIAMTEMARQEQENLVIVPGADHSLNTKTRTDQDFNSDKEHQWVKDRIATHFIDSLY